MLFNIINSIFMVKLNDVFIPSKNRTVYLQQIAQVQSSENILFSNRIFSAGFKAGVYIENNLYQPGW